MTDTNPLTELIRPYAELIKDDCLVGCERAGAVIKLYKLHCDCPSDPGAFGLCGAAFSDWLKHRKEQ